MMVRFPPLPPSSPPRRKVFISYHHADQYEVDGFVNTFDAFHDVFIARGLGLNMADDIVNSTDTDYVMRRIRELYLRDSTVTIVLIGRCTWARRYVDWELQASLRRGEFTTPNGLVGIVLPSAVQQPLPPQRLLMNLPPGDGRDGYARWYWYPRSREELAGWIEDAHRARTGREQLIVNPRDKFAYNKICP